VEPYQHWWWSEGLQFWGRGRWLGLGSSSDEGLERSCIEGGRRTLASGSGLLSVGIAALCSGYVEASVT
jgi:hypothetical protein